MLALHDLLGKLLYETLHTSNLSRLEWYVCMLVQQCKQSTPNMILTNLLMKKKSQYCFEEIQKHISIDSLIQNILSSNEIHDDHEHMSSLAPSKEFKPLFPYQDIQSEKINFLINVF